MDRLYEDICEVFGNVCKGWIKAFPKNVAEKFGIDDPERFCDFINKKFKELLELYREDEQRFTEEIFKIGDFLYDKGISIAFIVDITMKFFLISQPM
ncbi:hypothetical protein [Desulfurobacterium atlanticum]|uniref:Uncharacterized protein n=1 Tax=Desulfurobacterium atlanticum TaxID=240169 RepID=A0A238Z198_9BACT|nr:hypothetical protein [Desulfurobacterium atlanticum]SNR76711.1 hypothetical protein SAMN06265340_105147 [Desulfurobacterium atlanticum]